MTILLNCLFASLLAHRMELPFFPLQRMVSPWKTNLVGVEFWQLYGYTGVEDHVKQLTHSCLFLCRGKYIMMVPF